jgi:hypothetical protein
LAQAAAASAPPSETRPPSQVRDAPWWLYSAFFMGAQSIFGLYVAWVVLFDFNLAEAGPYLSPFFSPLLPAATVASFVISPGIYVVWSPLLFRVSCYYYRKAYHRAMFAPPACAMEPPTPLQRIKYRGEQTLPWVFNNLHRFFLYTAIINVAFLLVDVVRALSFQGHWYFGLGTLVLTLNVVMLSAYTFGCHAFRHLVGGSLDCYSCSWTARTRRSIWERVTMLNERHGLFALVSLFTVWGADLYVRLLAHGVISDLHVSF